MRGSKERRGRPERAGPRRHEADGRVRPPPLQELPRRSRLSRTGAPRAAAPLPCWEPLRGGRASPRRREAPGGHALPTAGGTGSRAPPRREDPGGRALPAAGGSGGRAPPHRRTWRTTRSSTRAAAPPHGDSASGGPCRLFFCFLQRTVLADVAIDPPAQNPYVMAGRRLPAQMAICAGT